MIPQVIKAGEYVIPMTRIAFVRAVYKTDYQGDTHYWLRAYLTSETVKGDMRANRGILSGHAEATLTSKPTFVTLGVVIGTAACDALKARIARAIGSGEPEVIDIESIVAEIGAVWFVQGGTRRDD